jgi:hypothetical protein
MILNIFYSLFFGILNLLIYSKLSKFYQFSKEYLFYLLIVIVLFIHLGFIKNNYLMTTKDFFNLVFFSVSLIILHYVTNIQVILFKKYNVPQDERGQKLQSILLSVFNFMRQKLIYIMIYVYQFLAIWNESYR